MILVILLALAYSAAALFLPLARAVEIFGGVRSIWLALPLWLRLKTARWMNK